MNQKRIKRVRQVVKVIPLDQVFTRLCKYPDTCGIRDCAYKHNTIPNCKFGNFCRYKHSCRFVHPQQPPRPPKFQEFPKFTLESIYKVEKYVELNYRNTMLVEIKNGVAELSGPLGQMIYKYGQIKENPSIRQLVFKL